MKVCEYCGHENSDSNKICCMCGRRLSTSEGIQKEDTKQDIDDINEIKIEEKTLTPKKRNKKTIILVSLILLLSLVATFFYIYSKKNPRLNIDTSFFIKQDDSHYIYDPTNKAKIKIELPKDFNETYFINDPLIISKDQRKIDYIIFTKTNSNSSLDFQVHEVLIFDMDKNEAQYSSANPFHIVNDSTITDVSYFKKTNTLFLKNNDGTLSRIDLNKNKLVKGIDLKKFKVLDVIEKWLYDENTDSIIYKNTSKEMHLLKNDGKNIFLGNSNFSAHFNKATSSIYYVDGTTVVKSDLNGKTTDILSDAYRLIKVFDDGSFYYTKRDGDNKDAPTISQGENPILINFILKQSLYYYDGKEHKLRDNFIVDSSLQTILGKLEGLTSYEGNDKKLAIFSLSPKGKELVSNSKINIENETFNNFFSNYLEYQIVQDTSITEALPAFVFTSGCDLDRNIYINKDKVINYKDKKVVDVSIPNLMDMQIVNRYKNGDILYNLNSGRIQIINNNKIIYDDKFANKAENLMINPKFWITNHISNESVGFLISKPLEEKTKNPTSKKVLIYTYKDKVIETDISPKTVVNSKDAIYYIAKDKNESSTYNLYMLKGDKTTLLEKNVSLFVHGLYDALNEYGYE